MNRNHGSADDPARRVLCIGSLLWDVVGTALGPMRPGDDRPGRIRRLPGGVAYNIAAALARAGLAPVLLSAVGADAEGRALLAAAEAAGIDTRHVLVSEAIRTDSYMAIEAGGSVLAALADAHGLEAMGARILAPLADGALAGPGGWRGPVVVDGNLTEEILAALLALPALAAAELRVAPASPGKAARLAPALASGRAVIHANLVEATLLTGRALDDAPAAARALVAAGARRAIVTDGPRPAADAVAGSEEVVIARPPEVAPEVLTGAGDCFLAAHLAAELEGASRAEALERAVAAAAAHVAGAGG